MPTYIQKQRSRTGEWRGKRKQVKDLLSKAGPPKLLDPGETIQQEYLKTLRAVYTHVGKRGYPPSATALADRKGWDLKTLSSYIAQGQALGHLYKVKMGWTVTDEGCAVLGVVPVAPRESQSRVARVALKRARQLIAKAEQIEHQEPDEPHQETSCPNGQICPPAP